MTNVRQLSSVESPSGGRYQDDFYERFADGPYRSAQKYVDLLWPLHVPESVVDLGCGRGSWLQAFKDHGVAKVVGYDGSWNSQEKMVDQAIAFRPADLSMPIETIDRERFDLAISVEVAEHIVASSASTFIDSLTRLSDIVLFGAAYIKQGGAHHVNEQQQTYWADLFLAHGYVPFDLFRPILWGDPDVLFWYQQNTFLYVKKNTPVFDRLLKLGKTPIGNIRFLNCVHPELYRAQLARIRKPVTLRSLIIH
jgi:SAM-dependent methyltransferase